MLEPRHIIRFQGGAVILLDQTRLPARRIERACRSVPELIDAIRSLAVRGAPLLGVTGAYGVALAATTGPDQPDRLEPQLRAQAALLAAARPTATNLGWGVATALRELDAAWADADVLRQRLLARARAIHQQEVARCRRIGAHGAALLPDRARIVTICNTGALATGGYGTALGVIRALHERGGDPDVVVCETRPALQGSRLTAFELAEAGIRCTIVTDAAAAVMMREGVDAVVVGADRIARNGDTANKIGTYALALAARHHHTPFLVAAPSTTIDWAAADASRIRIEQRDSCELATLGGRRLAPRGVAIRNDAFDITDAELITAIITERGVRRPPYAFAARAA